MSESKTPQAGEWWETRQGGRAYVAALLPDTSPIPSSPHSQLTGWLSENQRVVGGSWSRKGEWVMSKSRNDLVKHLPDCTGWDWQPPDWVELDPVNYGWHVLRNGVDWFFSERDNKWVSVCALGNTMLISINAKFRCLRKDLPQKPAEPVKPDPGKGWRLLEPDEKVIQGDEYLDPVHGGWEESINWKSPLEGKQHGFPYRRRVEPTTVTHGGPYVSIDVHQKVVAERDALLKMMREIEAKAKFYESPF